MVCIMKKKDSLKLNQTFFSFIYFFKWASFCHVAPPVVAGELQIFVLARYLYEDWRPLCRKELSAYCLLPKKNLFCTKLVASIQNHTYKEDILS